MSELYGYQGELPPGVSVYENINRALEFQANNSPAATLEWFFEHVRNNKDGHLPQSQSMDYKQIDPKYADLGNYNYGAVGHALGIPDAVLENAAGWAQGRADGLTNAQAITRALLDRENNGDNPGDQELPCRPWRWGAMRRGNPLSSFWRGSRVSKH